MLEKGNTALEQHRTQVARAESEALYYKELEKSQDNLKLKNQANLLTNQVKSLKQIIEIMEKEVSRPPADASDAVLSPQEKQLVQQGRLLEKWR